MKRLTLTLALVLIVAACGDDDAANTSVTSATTATPTTEATTTTATPAATTTTAAAATTTTAAAPATTGAPAPATGPDFQITSVSFGSPMVVIHNVGTESGSLAGYWLCQRPAYQEIPDIELAPGESVAISLGGNVFLPPPGALTIEGQLNLGALSASGGEIGLYSSNSFGSADAIVSYVEWGSSGHGRSGTAVEAGIWTDGGFVVTTGETAVIQAGTFTDFGSAEVWESF